LDLDRIKFLQPGIKLRGKSGEKDGAEDYCDMMSDGKWEWEKLGVYKDKNHEPTGSVIDGTMRNAETDKEKK